MTESVDAMDLTVAAILIGAGVLLGLVLRFSLGWVGRHLTRTRWGGDELLVGVVRGFALTLAVVIGLWAGTVSLPLRDAVRDAVDRTLVAVLILVATLFAARLAAELIRSAALARTGIAPSASIFVNVARIVIVAVGVLVLLGSLGVSVAPLLTALGVGGLAVALALQDTLSNLFAGIHILASKKVEPGDFVRLDTGEEGYVVDINWRNTTIRELSNNLVIIPNAKLANAIVTNFYRPEPELSVLVQVRVSYDSDLTKVEQVTGDVARDVLQAVEGGVANPEPFIRYHTFGDSSINFSVILRAREFTNRYLLTHEFIKRLHERYRREGIRIPFPIRTIVTADTNGAAQKQALPGGRKSAAH